MSYADSNRTQTLTAPIKDATALMKKGGLAIGNFLYGDDIRTKRSLTFSYLVILTYLLTIINAQSLSSCAL
ncbi:MAG: hypothetical protein MK052_04475 [Alphaproteobacteria bacterium]|nr:hypothetical protein [Alphaproteobacteria bacterium]